MRDLKIGNMGRADDRWSGGSFSVSSRRIRDDAPYPAQWLQGSSLGRADHPWSAGGEFMLFRFQPAHQG